MGTFRNFSFGGGEIAPALYARHDMIKNATGARLMRNFIVQRHGGAANRPGTKFVDSVFDPSKTSRLIPFRVQAETGGEYVLEFSELLIRVFRDGVALLDGGAGAAQAISAITNASPAVVTVGSTGSWANTSECRMTGIEGMDEINDRSFKVTVLNGTQISLQDYDDTDFDTTNFGTFTATGTPVATRILHIVSPYTAAQAQELTFVQSVDVMFLAHQLFQPRSLTRLTETTFSLATITFGPTLNPPGSIGASIGPAGTEIHRYRVTSVDANGSESLPSVQGAAQPLTSATAASPVVCTTTNPHTLLAGDQVLIEGVAGQFQLNDRIFQVTAPATPLFTLAGEDGSGRSAGTGGTFNVLAVVLTAGTPTTTNPHTLSWVSIPGAVSYNIYKEVGGVYGFLGTSVGGEFFDIGIAPDTADGFPVEGKLFDEAGEFPGSVTIFQQRLMFGNTLNAPETVFASKTGSFFDFSTTPAARDDDSIQFTMAGNELRTIKHMLDLGDLVIFSDGAEHIITGNANGVLTPSGINPTSKTRHGSSTIAPVVTGGNAVFFQRRGSIVRDLNFDTIIDGYRGNDLTVFAPHLFDDFTLADRTYQEIPHSLVWITRTDGKLLCLTYVREHQIFGWTQHDLEGGEVETVASVADTNLNDEIVYMTVKRTINGKTTRYIEHLTTRQIIGEAVEDMIFQDSAIQIDGTGHFNPAGFTLTGGPAWDETVTMTLTSDTAGTFLATDVDNAIVLHGTGADKVLFNIEGFTSDTVVTGHVEKDVPASLQGVQTTNTDYYRKTIRFPLTHLEGKQLSVLADGFVVANPNDPGAVAVTVLNGKATLDDAYCKISAGLPYTSDLETLDIDTAQSETLIDKKKNVQNIHMAVEETRGLWACDGTLKPETDAVGPATDLYELKVREAEPYESPVDLKTGTVNINIKSRWTDGGRIFIRQSDPLPVTILALAPSGYLPFS
jgi:hypothetical protein